MIKANVREGMQVCNGYLEHVTVLEVFEDGIGCSDGYVWEAEDLDPADHTYRHITE